jgi:capsular exopolysaccharide synthesis family protein
VRRLAISRRKISKGTLLGSLVAHSYPESIISEQFRSIQANIKFVTGSNESKIFLITSPNRGEGKSTAAANLAVSMAQQKEKVLLIDANLRNPGLHSIFNIQNSSGLTDILTGRTNFYDEIYHTEIGRLDVITSGPIPMNPVELLSSPLMRSLLINSQKSYDVILIDSYSVLELVDTKLLANQCDGIVLVIQSGKTGQDEALEAKRVIEFGKGNLIGVIIRD